MTEAAAGLKYDYVLDPDADTSGARIARLVGHGKRVLDVGCATGALARVLVARGCAVVGVEYDPESAKIAETVTERVIVGDLERVDLDLELGDDRFDVITAGDVLEHLREPARLLAALAQFLRPGGYLVLSVPNAAHASVRMALLHGQLPRTDVGLLDRTHVQFLTRAGLLDLLIEGGWRAAHLEATTVAAEVSEVAFPRDDLTAHALGSLEGDGESRVYQYIALAYPVGAFMEGGLPSLVEHLSRPGRETWDDSSMEERLHNAIAARATDGALADLAAADAQLHADRLEARLIGELTWLREERSHDQQEARARRKATARKHAKRRATLERRLAQTTAERDVALTEIRDMQTTWLWKAATLMKSLRARVTST